MAAAGNIEGLIQKQPLFSNLCKQGIEYVVSRAELIKLPEKGRLFSSGGKASRFYILKSGEIRILEKDDEGNEKETARFKSGETIGDFDFARGADYVDDAEADVDSELIVFPGFGKTIDSLISEKPETVCNILLNAVVMITARIKAANKEYLKKNKSMLDIHRRAYEDAGTGLWKQVIINDEVIETLKKHDESAALIMLKPDRFKILVDSRGHSAGDDAMVKIALILKRICRENDNGWPLRFKSNEVGIILKNCDAEKAEKICAELFAEITNIEKVPAKDDIPEFHFTTTISWCIWNKNIDWQTLFDENYANLLDTWKACGNTIVRCPGN